MQKSANPNYYYYYFSPAHNPSKVPFNLRMEYSSEFFLDSKVEK